MAAVIRVENVYKKYSRNANAHRNYTLQDLMRELLGRRPEDAFRQDEFWAVEDVSFECQPGESLALIGRNGAGKTTLLKMLNGLTKLDAGRIELEGRVQALINLGAGFTPALSGRDNIFNSAAIMGLSSRETGAIAEAVVEFAELEEFIDSPFGTYSSGMRARLGFSVAVHLRPDILLVDEILSVGDHSFQNKCLIKMQELKKSGVTIVLVSHSHTSVLQMCDRALWLHKGQAMRLGPAKQTVQAYLDFLEDIDEKEVIESNRKRTAKREAERAESARSAPAAVPAPATQVLEKAAPVEIEGLGVLSTAESAAVAPSRAADRTNGKKESDQYLYHTLYPDLDYIAGLDVRFFSGGEETNRIQHHAELVIEYRFRLKKEATQLNVSLVFYRKDGLQLCTISTLNGDRLAHVHDGEVHCRVRITDFFLNPGKYVLVMPIHDGKSYLYRDVVKEFIVKAGPAMAWNVADFEYDIEVLGP